MNALVNVLVDEDFLVHYHKNGDCHEPDDRNPERSRVWSELSQSAGDCQSESSRGWSQLQSRQAEEEDEVQVVRKFSILATSLSSASQCASRDKTSA